MTTREQRICRSVSLPARLAQRVRTLANNRKTSTNRVLVELIETGIEPMEVEKSKFDELADRLSGTSDPAEQKQIKELLADMTFGK